MGNDLAALKKKMRDKNRKKYVPKNENVYSYLLVNKTKLYSLGVLVSGLIVALSSFIFANMIYEVHWGLYAFPAILISAIVMLAPVSEDWVYKPWQRYPQQVERHYLD
jgi:hypothetical protein